MSTPVTLTGRMAAEPELSFTNDGKAIARFTVVTDRRKKNSSDVWESVDVTWWRCTAFDQLAENIAEHLTKGMAVIAQGNASQDDWTDREGNKRMSLKVMVNEIGENLRWAKRETSARADSSRSFDESTIPF